MKLYALPAGVFLLLAGSLFTGPPSQAQNSAPVLTAVPQGLKAQGLAQPIGSQILVNWKSVLRASFYRVYRDGAFLTDSPRTTVNDYAVAAGETHSYTLSSVGPAGESDQSSPVAATVPQGGGQTIFADTLENSWQSWGWAAMNFANAVPSHFGRSIQVTAGPWEAMYLHHEAFNTTPYDALSFWIHGGVAGGQSLQVVALRSGVPQTPVILAPLPAGQWRHIILPLCTLGVAAVPDMDGFWIQDSAGTGQPTFFVDEICLTSASPVLVPPSSPASLAVIPQWEPSCPVCGGMAMPHMVLTWKAVSGATSYTVYRDCAAVAKNLESAGWTDMNVTSGQTYAYAVSATGTGGEGLPCPVVSATAPNPPAASGPLTAPTNLAARSFWAGGVGNTLTWSRVPGAASYNVYQSDTLIAQGITGTIYSVSPTVIWGGALFTVTALDNLGNESLPSAPGGYNFGDDPAAPPDWTNYIPDTPDALVAAPEWNQGSPRIVIQWRGRQFSPAYNVYRDGVEVASAIWRTYYVDAAVQPGETHTYFVTSLNTDWAAGIESPASLPVTATALSAAPVSYSGKVQITKVVPNDDSAVVFFAPIPGAVDYRLYDVGNPSKVKYAGDLTVPDGGGYPVHGPTPLCIQWNGIDPAAGANLVVEAVDKFGPFQKMDGVTGDGAMNMNGMMNQAINGQGDPSNVPTVLAQSDPFHVDCVPVSLTGQQAFFDNFRSETPLVPQPLPTALPGSQYYGDPNGCYASYDNDKWEIREYGSDITNSQLFFMGSHFMDTTYDGGGPTSSIPAHNNNASMVMVPKATADISGGKVLHVTFEVDAHMDGRRWCELMVGAAGDTLIDAAKFEDNGLKPTVSGQLLRWQIQDAQHTLQVFLGDGNTAGVDLIQPTDYLDSATVFRMANDHVSPLANGTRQDLDKRHRFDLYLSKTHYRLQETTPDGTYNVTREKDFPPGTSLPFDQCQVYFVHQVYHTANDRMEQMEFYPYNSYWYNDRPFSDERHWDNLGFEVLDAFPANP